MAFYLPNGVKLFLATTYAAADTVTALTNANPAVATTGSAHGITTGSYFEATSGWQLANERIFRAAAASGSTLSYEGLNAVSTVNYPAGTGIGTIREITAWTQITQVTDFSTSGGEPKFVNFELLEEDFERQLPNGSSAQSLAFSIADDPALAGYIALAAASDARSLVALRLSFLNGSQIVFNGYPFLNVTPSLGKGAVATCSASFSLSGRPTRYAA